MQTLRIRSLSAVDRVRLRGLPSHPVHAAALDTMHRYSEGRIIVARALDRDDIRGYLTYHSLNADTVMLDYLYSPWGGGCGSGLVHKFEAGHVGSKAVLMCTVNARPFYQRLGYEVDGHFFMLSKRL